MTVNHGVRGSSPLWDVYILNKTINNYSGNMTNFHNQYEKCFLRAVALLEKYHIAKLMSHEHPEFDFEVKPNRINYAKAIFGAESKDALEGLIAHLKQSLIKIKEPARIEETHRGNKYLIEIKPDERLPQNTWIEQTARVVCGLAADIKDYRMKNKSKT